MNSDQQLAEFQKIKKKQDYCCFPAVFSFIASVIYSAASTVLNTGTNLNVVKFVFFSGGFISWVLISYHLISTKCPFCNQRFYSLWLLIGFGNIRKYSCCNCKTSLLPISPKSFQKFNGDEWNQ
jgi:hypothetical protein